MDASIGSRRFMLRDVLTWLFTQSIKGGIRTVKASSWNEAVIWLSTLYNWWMNGYDSHTSHLAFHDGTRYGAPPERGRNIGNHFDRALLNRPTLARMVFAQLPNVGFEKSAALMKRFPSVEQLVKATEEEMEEVEGIGKVIAQKIYKALREGRRKEEEPRNG